LDVVVDGGFQRLEGASDFDFGGGLVGVQERAQQPVLEFGVEHGDADAFGGEVVGVAVGEALDESVQAQASEVVAHLALAVVLVEESGDEPAKAFVGEAGDGTEDVAEGAGQGYCSCVPEAQRSGSVASRL
jgi:hypothetical protein